MLAYADHFDRIIEDFNRHPEKYDNNPWMCYEKCKHFLQYISKNKQRKNDYIDYIYERLGI